MFNPPPTHTSSSTVDKIFLHSNSGKKISALYLPHPETKQTILLSHGNSEDIMSILPTLKKLNSLGFSVLAYDYEGYGESEGHPNELNTYQAIDAAYDYLTLEKGVPPKSLILYGRSIGTGPTIDLAIRKPIAGVILECPFVSLYRIITILPLIPYDKYKNLQKVPLIEVPVLVIHGDKDEVISFWHGKKIYQAIQSKKQFYWVQGAHHNDIIEIARDGYWDVISQFIHSLGPSQ